MPIPNNSAARIIALLLATLLFSSCSPAAKKARTAERADRYFKSGEYDKAKVEYMNLLRLDHQNITAFQQLGFIWSEQGVPLRAIPFLLKIRELAPQNTPARSKLALAFMALGDRIEARKEAMSILQRDQANPDAIILLADTSQTKEEIAAADEQLQKFPHKDTAAYHLATGSLAVHKGDLGAAASEIEQAVAADPKSARAHLVMGYLYVLRKNPTHAGPELKTAAELAPLRSEERIKYAEFQAANGAADEAKGLLQKTTKEAPDYIPAWRNLAQIALTEKKYDEAISLLENVFSRDPDNPEARILQANIWLAKGDSGKAVAILDKLNTTYPNNPLIKFQIARAYVQNKNLPQATVALEQAIAAKPDFNEAILALAELNLRTGKVQAVIPPMEDLLKKHPDLPQARLFLSDAYRALGKLDQAALLFRDQIKATPDAAEAHLFLGMILRQQKKNDEARQELEKAIELAPNDLRPVDQLVEMDIADQRYDAAMQHLHEQLEKNPNVAGTHFLQGKIYAAQKNWPRAEAELQKAIDINGNFAAAYDLLVQVYLAENKMPEVIRQLEAELAKNPNNPRALMIMGFVYMQMKEYPKARDAYEKILALNQDSVPALNNLAYIYSDQLPQPDRAYELGQKAKTLEPNDPSIADTLGWILYKKSDYERAFELLQESAAKLPDNPEVQFHLGMAASMMGKGNVARAALEQAVHGAVDFPGKDEAQRRLVSLQSSAAQQETQPARDLNQPEKQQPNDVLASIRDGETHEQKGETAQAAAAYEQVLKANPKLLAPTLKLAQLYAGPLHSEEKAVQFAKKARELAPNDPQTAAVVGRIAFQVRNFTWAYSLLQESARKNSNDPTVLHDFALAAYAMGRVPEARQAVQRSLDAAPNGEHSEEVRRFLAMTALDQPSPQAVVAESEVQKILNDQPNYVPAMMAKAAIQLQQKETNAAADIYSHVLQIYPDFAPAQKRLATLYAENPEALAKAYDLAMKARKILPDDSELARTLARISFKRKEFSYAVQLFEQSATKEPLSAQDLYYLGMAQLQSRQEAKGRETLERALAAGLQGPFAQEAKKRLAEQPK